MIEIDSIMVYLVIFLIVNFQERNLFTHFFIFYVFYVSYDDVSFSFFSLYSYFILMTLLILKSILIIFLFLIIEIYLKVIQNLKFNQEVHTVAGFIHLIKFFYGNLTYLLKLVLNFCSKHLIIIL
jgi:hypothetical protein